MADRALRLALALSAMLLCPIALGSCPTVRAHVRAAAVLSRSSGATHALARMYDEPILVENVLLRTRHGPFRARIYRPRGGEPKPGVVVAHGVHYLGIDEPRLVPFARNLARAGLVVITPELMALADYRVDQSSVDEIIEASRYLAERGGVTQGRVGLFGLSFAGGLALVAAADPRSRSVIDRVAVMGAHYDLRKVLRFLATDTVETPSGLRTMRAHDYGLVVFVYMYADRFVAPAEVALFRDCLRLQLHVEGAQARHTARLLSPSAKALFDQILRGDKSAVRDTVLRVLEEPRERERIAALSPAGRAAALHGMRISVLHGARDDVVPPTEAEDCARELRGEANVTLLLTPAIRHVGVERPPSLGDQLRIVRSFARLFGG
jgi:dienelactone hydrolase